MCSCSINKAGLDSFSVHNILRIAEPKGRLSGAMLNREIRKKWKDSVMVSLRYSNKMRFEGLRKSTNNVSYLN
jgi:hypothetical protein